MRYRVSHTTKYAYSAVAPVCQNKVHLAPRNTPNQRLVDFGLLIVPDPSEVGSDVDFFGNRIDYFAIRQAHHGLTVKSSSVVDVTPPAAPAAPAPGDPWEQVAATLRTPATADLIEASLYRFPSDLIPIGAEFAELAKASFTTGRGIHESAVDFMGRIHQQFKYTPGVTDVSTSVEQVLETRSGVCQDFAHVAIAALRSLGLAARYVSGYLRTYPPTGKPRLVGADASHAWLSIYCGAGGWMDLDPTNNVVPAAEHITVAYGRDYADVCPIQGVFIGGGDHTMTVAVDVEPLEG